MDAPPAAAAAVFGARLDLARRYADRLAGDGVVRGLIGPREVPRLWSRHLLNCAVVADLLPQDARVVDVGSGAGLPGVPLAIRRVDLSVDLVEPMQRRTAFLQELVPDLELAGQVRVVRGRADDAEVQAAVGDADWVVARAVAPLDRLVRWCWPLLRPGGRLLAMKGDAAARELTEAGPVLRLLGASDAALRVVGEGELGEPVRVVSIERGGASGRRSR